VKIEKKLNNEVKSLIVGTGVEEEKRSNGWELQRTPLRENGNKLFSLCMFW
jgi:hypothetical protein